MAILRACVTCGKPSPNSYCDAHTPEPWAGSKRHRKVTIPRSQEQARRQRILERHLNCCHICGQVFPPQELEADHVIPLGEDGPDTEDNMAPACVPCHKAKTAEESRRARSRT